MTLIDIGMYIIMLAVGYVAGCWMTVWYLKKTGHITEEVKIF